MRIRTLALALALCFGSTAMIEAAPAKQKTFKIKKPKDKRYKQSKAAKVKPRKAKKTKPAHRG
jgi:hypothetical protein